jgi:hypothetical protein
VQKINPLGRHVVPPGLCGVKRGDRWLVSIPQLQRRIRK